MTERGLTPRPSPGRQKTTQAAVLRAALGDIHTFSKHVVGRELRPYQLEPARAIEASIFGKQGFAITVEMSRQAGKNELGAQLEAHLLNLYQRAGGSIVKAAPTFKPQVINSKLRLEGALANPWNAGKWRSEMGYMLRLGKARMFFFSAEPAANVVGATASILMEFDEAQDIDPEKHDKDFMPMGATTNVTRAYFGTAWDDRTLLERQKQRNLELEKKDGVRRHFEYPWDVVAECNPLYGAYVQAERERLGADHPLFRTQYLLQPLGGEGRFLSPQQRAQLVGDHPRYHAARAGLAYVAGVDVAGEDEADQDATLRAAKPRKDSTVITIAEVEPRQVAPGITTAALRVVDHYWWTGRAQVRQYEHLLDLLHNVWRVQRVCVDASGIGAGLAGFLAAALGETVMEPFRFSAASKSELGFDFLAAVNAGGFKVYREDATEGPGWSIVGPDGVAAYSPEAREFWTECRLARYEMRANQQISFYVDEAEGHDDFLMSAALCARAGRTIAVSPASAVVAPRPLYEDGRY
ncbi:MAG: hypothetical protein M0Z94_11450 [Dehalococcoidales bacterium]|nr:hypothetical protein [Dehalococcoidales bacterium]